MYISVPVTDTPDNFGLNDLRLLHFACGHIAYSSWQAFVTFQSRQRLRKLKVALHNVITAKSWAMSGLTADIVPVASGVGAATCKRARKHAHWHAASASWRTDRNSMGPTIGAAVTRWTRCVHRSRKEHPRTQRGGFSLPRQICSARQLWETIWGSSSGLIQARFQWQAQQLWVPVTLQHQEQQETGQSIRAPNVKSFSLDSMLRVAILVQQIMTEFNGAVSQEIKIVVITKTVLNLMKQNGY
jgi:hypothetical protein